MLNVTNTMTVLCTWNTILNRLEMADQSGDIAVDVVGRETFVIEEVTMEASIFHRQFEGE